MFAKFVWTLVATGMVLILGGCESEALRKSIFRTTSFDRGISVLTGAKQRVVTNVKANIQGGQNEPTRIVCAEPSPDVAQALSTALTAAASVEVKGQGGASASFGKSSAESVAQLGERLGTIQLLRDGLYRACEAYANGAISDITYAVLLSRYDDTMVSMLTAELAAGAFGRSLAALGSQAGTEASTKGSMDALVEKDKQTVAQKEKELAVAESKQEDREAERDEAKESDPTGDNSEKEKAAADAQKNTESAKDALKIATEALTKTNAAATAVAAGAITRLQNPAIAETLAKMQRKYMENINADALIVACITVMSKAAYKDSALTEACKGKDGIIRQVLHLNGELLISLKSRSSLEHSVKNIIKAKKTLKTVEIMESNDNPEVEVKELEDKTE